MPSWAHEALAVVGQAIGAFYVLAALLAVRRLRLDWFMNKALAQLTLNPTGDKPLLRAITGFALLYGVAGAALLMRSAWALWLLAAGVVGQAIMLGWRYFGSRQTPTRETTHAAGLSLLAFAVAALAWHSGKLV